MITWGSRNEVLRPYFDPSHCRKSGFTQDYMLINRILGVNSVSLCQRLGELMEARNHNPCTAISFSLLLLQDRMKGDASILFWGLTNLYWELFSLFATPPNFLQRLCSWA